MVAAEVVLGAIRCGIFQYSLLLSSLLVSVASSIFDPSSVTPFQVLPLDFTNSVAWPLSETVALPSGLYQHRSPPDTLPLLAFLPRIGSLSSAQALNLRSM